MLFPKQRSFLSKSQRAMLAETTPVNLMAPIAQVPKPITVPPVETTQVPSRASLNAPTNTAPSRTDRRSTMFASIGSFMMPSKQPEASSSVETVTVQKDARGSQKLDSVPPSLPKKVDPVPPSLPKKETVRSIAKYTAKQSKELSFEEGEEIIVLEKSDNGWWKGQLANGKVGLFSMEFAMREIK